MNDLATKARFHRLDGDDVTGDDLITLRTPGVTMWEQDVEYAILRSSDYQDLVDSLDQATQMANDNAAALVELRNVVSDTGYRHIDALKRLLDALEKADQG